MNKTKTIYFLSAIVCIIGCYALNLSYSLFVQTETKSVVDATVPSLSYSLETSEFTIPPSSETITGATLVKLKVINSGTVGINYGISIDDVKGTSIKVVSRNDNEIIGELASSNIENEPSYKEVWLYVTNQSDTEVSLTFNLTAKYNTIEFDSDGSFKENSKISGEKSMNLYETMLMDDRVEINDNEPDFSQSATTEEGLYKIEENNVTNGYSYYYRGAQTYNYVEFAGMCWRMMRSTNSGNIKLALAKDGKCSSITADDKNSALILSDVPITNYQEEFGAFRPVTPEYGYRTDSIYNNKTGEYIEHYLADYNGYTGGLKTTLENWFNEKFKTEDSLTLNEYGNMLGNETWCLGGQSGWLFDENMTSYSWIGGEHVVGDDYYYPSAKRLMLTTPPSPTLTCWDDGEDELQSYIGTLTADEVALAGATFESNLNPNNKMFYLNDNVNWEYYTLSMRAAIYEYDGYYVDDVFIVAFGGLYNSYSFGMTVKNSIAGVRPVVSLLSDNAFVSAGDGTLNNPYIIESANN